MLVSAMLQHSSNHCGCRRDLSLGSDPAVGRNDGELLRLDSLLNFYGANSACSVAQCCNDTNAFYIGFSWDKSPAMLGAMSCQAARCCGFRTHRLIKISAVFFVDPRLLKAAPSRQLNRPSLTGVKCLKSSVAVAGSAAGKSLGYEIWVEEIILFRLQKAVPNLSGEVIYAQIAMQCMMNVLWINQRA